MSSVDLKRAIDLHTERLTLHENDPRLDEINEELVDLDLDEEEYESLRIAIDPLREDMIEDAEALREEFLKEED